LEERKGIYLVGMYCSRYLTACPEIKWITVVGHRLEKENPTKINEIIF